MKIKLLQSFLYCPDTSMIRGHIEEVADKIALDWISGGLAVEVKEVETAVKQPYEKAVRPHKRTKKV